MASKKVSQPDKRMRNLIIIIIAAAVVAAVAIVTTTQPQKAQSFESGYAEMSGSWKENGVQAEKLHEVANLAGLQEKQLAAIRAGLVRFESSQNPAVRSIALIYIKSIDSALKTQEIGEAIAAFEREEDLCRQLQLSKGLVILLREQVALAEWIEEQRTGFTAEHAKESEYLGLSQQEKRGFEAYKEEIRIYEATIKEMEAEC